MLRSLQIAESVSTESDHKHVELKFMSVIEVKFRISYHALFSKLSKFHFSLLQRQRIEDEYIYRS